MTLKICQVHPRTLRFLKSELDFVACKKTYRACLYQHEAGQLFQETWQHAFGMFYTPRPKHNPSTHQSETRAQICKGPVYKYGGQPEEERSDATPVCICTELHNLRRRLGDVLVEQNLASTEAFLDLDQAQAHPWPYLCEFHSRLLCILQCPQRISSVPAEAALQNSDSAPHLGCMYGLVSASFTVAGFVSSYSYTKSEGRHLKLIGQLPCMAQSLEAFHPLAPHPVVSAPHPVVSTAHRRG